jgi:predicted kinase
MTMSLKAPSLREQDARRILDYLRVPSAPATTTPLLIAAVGLPGSGKSTFSRRLAPKIGAAVLESDELRGLLFAAPVYSSAENRRVFRALHLVARQLLERGVPVIIDATSLRERDRRPIATLAAVTGARLMLLHFTAQEQVIEERLARRAAPGSTDSSRAGFGVYLLMADTAQPPEHVDWLIDTSDPAAADSLFWQVVADCRRDTTSIH